MKRHLWFLLLSFVFVALFSRATSFHYAYEGGDPALFKQMGLALLQGKHLYTDLFDNKGCILFFIQALGLALGGNIAIMLLQTLSLTLTLVLWDKILAFRHGTRQRNLYLGLLGILLLCFYYNGDLSEEWCLPLATWPILAYLQRGKGLKSSKGEKGLKSSKGEKGLKSSKSSKGLKGEEPLNSFNPLNPLNPFYYFLAGLCFGAIAFIRINNACAMVGFVAYAMLTLVLDKRWKDFAKALACFLGGTAIIACLCLGYFYLTAGWSGVDDMLYATFTSNFEYIGLRFYPTWHALTAYSFLIIVAIVLQVINTRKEKDILIPTMIGYACFVLGFGTCCFVHYLMALLPLVVVLLMSLKPEKLHQNRKVALVTIVPLLYYIAYPLGLFGSEVMLGKDPYKKVYNDFHEVVETMPQDEREQIYVYNLSGLGSGMMQHEGLVRCNRIFYWPQHQLPRLLKEQEERPMAEPSWIMLSWDRHYELNDSVYIVNNYELKHQITADLRYLQRPVQLGEVDEVWLYRRKN